MRVDREYEYTWPLCWVGDGGNSHVHCTNEIMLKEICLDQGKKLSVDNVRTQLIYIIYIYIYINYPYAISL